MSTATDPRITRPTAAGGEQRFLIHNLGWDKYEILLAIFEDGGPRINYRNGDVELMSPQISHERSMSLLGFVVEALTEELDIPRNMVGSTTFKRRDADRGLEADESCYLWDNAGKIGDQKYVDLDIDPPPDLAIVVEYTSSMLDKIDIYAKIGVPEVWKYDGETLKVLVLGANGGYTESPTSRAFPFLLIVEIVRFLREYDPSAETRWRRGFRAWVREVVLPVYLERSR